MKAKREGGGDKSSFTPTERGSGKNCSHAERGSTEVLR